MQRRSNIKQTLGEPLVLDGQEKLQGRVQYRPLAYR